MHRQGELKERGKRVLMMHNSKKNHTKMNEYKRLAAGLNRSGVEGFEAVEESFDNAPDMVCFSHLR